MTFTRPRALTRYMMVLAIAASVSACTDSERGTRPLLLTVEAARSHDFDRARALDTARAMPAGFVVVDECFGESGVAKGDLPSRID